MTVYIDFGKLLPGWTKRLIFYMIIIQQITKLIMTNKKIIGIGLINALGTALYVCVIALFFRNASKIFGKTDTFFTPVAMLLLLVLSATITSSLVLGRPILLYMENHKSEAIKMFFSTVGWLFAITLVVFLIMIINRPSVG